ncbi:MAG: hypothetical protein M1818_000620 [Claussenomyces sp. TS43310]|nr:MAG: hypothetical protein M1818_000620 [Claussenomyces sp. TS43310]
MSADFWAGYISGAVGILIGNPLDLIKVRLQAAPSTSGDSTSTTRTRLSNPFTTISSLIRGSTAPIVGYGALNALLFMTYNRSTLLLNDGVDPKIQLPSLGACFVAGALGGLATWAVSTPTELIKCRAQMSSAPISSLQIARAIFRAEGIRGLYFGGTVTALRDSIGYGFYFWSYELSTRVMASKDQETATPGAEAARVLLCGGLAGVLTWASVFPLDVIKTRIQTQTNPDPAAGSSGVRQPLLGIDPGSGATQVSGRRIGALEMARQTYSNEGVAVFFRGLGVCSIRAFVVNAAQWAVYEWIMTKLQPGSEMLVASNRQTISKFD